MNSKARAAKSAKLSMSTARADRPSKQVQAVTEGQARLTIEIPTEAHRHLKAHASIQGKTIRDCVLAWLERDGIYPPKQ